MPRLIWTPPALADVQRLYRFLAPKDADAARRAVKAIRAGVGLLARQPHVGRPVEDPVEDPVEGMDAAFREWLIDFGNSGYVALYRIDRDAVVILAVRHQREAGY